MNKILYLMMLLQCPVLMAQRSLQPDGGGEFIPERTECVSAAEYERIHLMLSGNKDSLSRIGVLPRPTHSDGDQILSGNLLWPIRQKAGLNYNSVYGISGFVDRNPAFPNQLQDWNCGRRTYDLSTGYNHSGIDIFSWPFPQQLQANEGVEIVAAIGGIIIGKDDGYADNSCSMSGAQWNAVYIQGTDGNTYWYGHMKKNSLTSKAIGASVAQGEKIGIVGSSGNSTGPHLHFEMYDANNVLLDPYHGPCNSAPSLWQDQKPYYEPTINALMTHGAAPVMPACPQLETINAKNYFRTGDDIFYGAYFHDHIDIPAVHQLIRPDQSIHETWTQQLNPDQYFSASWWYWARSVTEDMPDGVWTYKVTFDDKVQTHTFYVNVDSGTSVNAVEKRAETLQIFPNPGRDKFTISGPHDPLFDITISDLTGAVVYQGSAVAQEGRANLNLQLAPGYYIIHVTGKTGKRYSGKLVMNE